MPLGFIVFGLMIFASNMLVSVMAGDPAPLATPSIDAHVAAFAGLFASPVMRPVGILSMLVGGFLYMFSGAPLFRSGADEVGAADHHWDEAPRRPRRPTLSPVAKAASDRVGAALGRLRSMPADTFSPEARLEYEAIRDKHLPSLRDAHAKARAAYLATTPQATTIDADLAGSLDLIAGKLHELIEECGDEARNGFDVERRFVELRHPSSADPLALPAVQLVERSA